MLNKKIAVFTGTRADYGLLYWLMKDINSEPSLELQIIASGMHMSPEFGLTINTIEADGFNVDEKVEVLLSSDTANSVVKSMGLGLISFGEVLERLAPDLLIILGDRFEALAMAQAAAVFGVPILHLHGGEITEGAYDDMFRHAITKLSQYHMVSTQEYYNRVVQMGENPDRVKNTGAIGLDHLNRTDFMTLNELSESLDFKLDKPFFIVTYHPVTRSSVEESCAFENLLSVLDEYSDFQLIMTYPNADNGGREIIGQIEKYAIQHPTRVKAMKSLGQKRYLSSVKFSSGVIGNSSSGIIEVPSFDVPTLNLGERQKGRISADSVIHCDSSKEGINAAMTRLVEGLSKDAFKNVVNPYGAGNVSTQIVDFIKDTELSPFKRFNDLVGE